VSLSRNPGTLTSWNPLGHSSPVTGMLYLYLSLSKQMLGAYPKIDHDSFLPHPLEFILHSSQPSDDTQNIGFQRVQSATEERVDLLLMYTQFLTTSYSKKKRETSHDFRSRTPCLNIYTLAVDSRISYSSFQNKYHL
jgi:hypothetical protein